jgi:hypothetical protein
MTTLNYEKQFHGEPIVALNRVEDMPPKNRVMLIQEGSLNDMQAWFVHYLSLNIPHVVTRTEKRDGNGARRTVFRIWKERG